MQDALVRQKFEVEGPVQGLGLHETRMISGSAPELSRAAINESAPVQTNSFGNQISAMVLNSDLLFKNNEIELSKVLVFQALSLDSAHPEALKRIPRYLNPERESDKIIRIYETLMKVDNSPETLMQLANQYYKAGRDREALEKYFETLGLMITSKKDLFEIYKNIGNIYVKDSDFEGAQEYYHKAHTLNAESDVLLVNLGTLDVQKSDYESALERFRKALEINPKNDKAWVGLALVHQHFGDFELAKANLENAIDENAGNRTAVHLLANLSMRFGRVENAIPYLQNYLAAVEQDEEMSLVLIHMFCMASFFDMALFEIQRLLVWNPDHQEVRDLEKQILAKLKKA